MGVISNARMVELLGPYAKVSEALASQLGVYLELLLKWNARTNLTAIREPEEIVRRHFGESLFAAQHLGEHLDKHPGGEGATLLDLGSGAGFPGLPIQLARPELRVTLAESQNKKAAFLREAVRTLGVATEVWAGRAEALPGERMFDVVTLRAVDNMPAALAAAEARALRRLVVFSTEAAIPPLPATFVEGERVYLTGPAGQQLLLMLADRTTTHIK